MISDTEYEEDPGDGVAIKDRLLNGFFYLICFIPHYLAYVVGAVVKAIKIGFMQGWDRILAEPEENYDPKRYSL